MNENTTAISTCAIAEYNPIAQALASVEKFRGLVCDVTTERGMAEAKAAHREVAALRIALEKTRKKVKEDVVARGKLIDGEANRIFALIAAIEDPIKKQIDAEEERIERERQAAIEAEQRRLAEEEAAKKRAEEEELARKRAEIARQEAALKAKQEEAEREAKARRDAIAAEEEAARRRIAEAEEKARAERKAEDDRLRAEREKVEAERRKLEEDARAEQFRKDEEARAARLEEQRKRDAEENERRAQEHERRMKEAERLDSRRMLETFCQRFEHLHPELAAHIREYLAQADLRVAA